MAAFMLISSFSFADAYKVLTFPDGNSKEISAYTETWSVTLENFTWTIENFNNNKNAWAYIKCGRKNNGQSYRKYCRYYRPDDCEQGQFYFVDSGFGQGFQ